jgi:transcription initiation factor TFIIA large subunit
MPQQQQQMPQQQQQMPQQQQQRPPPQQGHLYTSQTDGSGDALADWEALKAARAADIGERIAADEFMRARLDAMAMRQDSGLMVPLDTMPKGKKRKNAVRVLQAEDAVKTSPTAAGPARFDGDEDVKPEEDPEDAINSTIQRTTLTTVITVTTIWLITCFARMTRSNASRTSGSARSKTVS